METVGIVAVVVISILAIVVGIPVLLLLHASRNGRNPFN